MDANTDREIARILAEAIVPVLRELLEGEPRQKKEERDGYFCEAEPLNLVAESGSDSD